uniref:Uncharacterized protein n=1 Tax=Anguilla anguilla TaxID=7936 RepID=A0A0E9WRF2_ANGAN
MRTAVLIDQYSKIYLSRPTLHLHYCFTDNNLPRHVPCKHGLVSPVSAAQLSRCIIIYLASLSQCMQSPPPRY